MDELNNRSSMDDALHRVNPTSGLPMVGMGTGVDVAGNGFGCGARTVEQDYIIPTANSNHPISKRKMAIGATAVLILWISVFAAAALTH